MFLGSNTMKWSKFILSCFEMCLKEWFLLRMKYIFDFGLSISNIFKMLKINGFVNYLLLNKYGNIFQYEMKGLKLYLLEIKWEVNVWNFIFWR